MPAGRDVLLAAVVEHLGQHGIGDTSLRSLATAVGSSHRMLIYHFGSRDGLLAEVVRAVEDEQRTTLARVFADLPDAAGPAALVEVAERFWTAVVEATLRYGGLFFELAGQAVQGHAYAASLRRDLIDGWLPGVVELLVRLGVDPAQAPSAGRLALGASRGLLLDLLATGDRAGVDEAAALLNRWLATLVVR